MPSARNRLRKRALAGAARPCVSSRAPTGAARPCSRVGVWPARDSRGASSRYPSCAARRINGARRRAVRCRWGGTTLDVTNGGRSDQERGVLQEERWRHRPRPRHVCGRQGALPRLALSNSRRGQQGVGVVRCLHRRRHHDRGAARERGRRVAMMILGGPIVTARPGGRRRDGDHQGTGHNGRQQGGSDSARERPGRSRHHCHRLTSRRELHDPVPDSGPSTSRAGRDFIRPG